MLALGLVALVAPSGCLVGFGSRPGERDAAPDRDGDASGIPDGQAHDGAPWDGEVPDGGGYCGNAVVETGEECDDGNLNDNDGCTNECRSARCGDGILYIGVEECDDGNGDNTDSCLDDCTTARCGDGFIWTGMESCDDGDAQGGDGCSTTCQTEPGWSCSGQPSVCSAVCGDGLIRGEETCDDGGAASGDGCSSTCRVETGWTCSGQPSICFSICGDGLIRGDEQCDDGNTTNGDGCSSLCRIEALPVLHSHLGSSWSSQIMTYADSPHAPTAAQYPIRAAAAASGKREAFVFTSTTYHVLSLPGLTWIRHGNLSSLFPGLPVSTRTLLAAMAFPWSGSTDIYFFYSDSLVYFYQYSHSTNTATQAPDSPSTLTHWESCCGASVPSATSFRASWYDAENSRGWTSGDWSYVCGPDCPCGPACDTGSVGAYAGYITTANQVHLQEIGCCFQFYAQMPASSFAPFGQLGAPSMTATRAAFFDTVANRLYVITSP